MSKQSGKCYLSFLIIYSAPLHHHAVCDLNKNLEGKHFLTQRKHQFLKLFFLPFKDTRKDTTIFRNWKAPQNYIKFYLISYFVFPFHQKWSCICKLKEILKQKAKQKVLPESKKIFSCLVCQNQALDYFHISLLKELACEIESKVP